MPKYEFIPDSHKKYLIKKFEDLLAQYSKIKISGYHDSVMSYHFMQIRIAIKECIKAVKVDLTNNPWIKWDTTIEEAKHPKYKKSDGSGDDHDSREPTDLRDDWPHARSGPGGARLDFTEGETEIGVR